MLMLSLCRGVGVFLFVCFNTDRTDVDFDSNYQELFQAVLWSSHTLAENERSTQTKQTHSVKISEFARPTREQ